MKMKLIVSMLLLILSVSAWADDGAKVLFHDNFENDLSRAVQMRAANQPYEQHELAISTDRAKSGRHSLKLDLSFHHGIGVYLSPRSNETPRIQWGSLGGPGAFVLKGLDIPLTPGDRYVLSMWVWIEQTTHQSPIRINLEMTSHSDYGQTLSSVVLDKVFDAPTQGWVRVQQEIGSTVVDQLDAGGANIDDLRLHSINIGSFSLISNTRITAYVDDVRLVRLPGSAKNSTASRLVETPDFRRYPQVEDQFIWGVYGGLLDGLIWLDPRKPGVHDERLRQIEIVKGCAAPILLDLRRHYINTLFQGGGMLFPNEDDTAYDYVEAVLDKAQMFGVKMVPSTYLSQHYASSVSKQQCQQAMQKAVTRFGNHPGLLAYLLVDEPGTTGQEDFFWSKQYIESLDANHPALGCLNSIDSIATYAPVLPLAIIDYYPISPVPSDDKGAWAVGDSVRYARQLGAKRIWVIPQAFQGPSWRSPSVEELGIQVFGSLGEGATGFIPFVYASGHAPRWANLNASYYEKPMLGDPYGNSTPLLDFMKRWGLSLRSAGPLLMGASLIDDDLVAVTPSRVIASNVGRKRPAVGTRLFQDPKREVRYLLVYNNTVVYDFNGGTIHLGRVLKPGDRVVDMFARREVATHDGLLNISIPKGEAHLFAIASPQQVEVVRQEVAQRRFELQSDLAKLELEVAQRMGIDVAPVKILVVEADTLSSQQDWTAAETRLSQAMQRLSRQQEAHVPYHRSITAIEQSRAALGRISHALDRTMDQWKTDNAWLAMIEPMKNLSRRFFTLQGQLYSDGPEGLPKQAQAMLRDVIDFERKVYSLLGKP